jgi:hypothetical protein
MINYYTIKLRPKFGVAVWLGNWGCNHFEYLKIQGD